MRNDISEILLTQEQIKARIAELGKELSEEYKDKNPIVVGVLKGVVPFYADMIRAIEILVRLSRVLYFVIRKAERAIKAITEPIINTGLILSMLPKTAPSFLI